MLTVFGCCIFATPSKLFEQQQQQQQDRGNYEHDLDREDGEEGENDAIQNKENKNAFLYVKKEDEQERNSLE